MYLARGTHWLGIQMVTSFSARQLGSARSRQSFPSRSSARPRRLASTGVAMAATRPPASSLLLSEPSSSHNRLRNQQRLAMATNIVLTARSPTSWSRLSCPVSTGHSRSPCRPTPPALVATHLDVDGKRPASTSLQFRWRTSLQRRPSRCRAARPAEEEEPRLIRPPAALASARPSSLPPRSNHATNVFSVALPPTPDRGTIL